MSNRTWRENQFRCYPIKYEKIIKLPHNDPKVDELIAANEPVVITDTELVSSANVWDIDYLEKHMGSGTYTVITSKNHKFKYYDEKKVSSTPNFFPATKRSQMEFSEFVRRMKTWRKGEERVYLQQPIDNSVGTTIVKDFGNFNWRWVTEKQVKHKWGPMTSNLLLISMPGNVTPCHYDEQQNFYAQIKGHKKCILFRPSQFNCLYPHPVHHPYDRQSQIDFDRPDYTKFPNFRDVTGFETVLEPGDVLYIPVYWFHHMESRIRGSYTVSINFWYKTGPTGQVTYPLKDYQKVAIMRNIEKMLGEALHDNKEVGTLLKTLVSGRYE